MDTIYFLYSFIFGALVGSFLNVVIFRLPDENQSVIFPASHCPKCSTKLRWFENIPILSWLALRGKCRTCKAPISLQYPVVELCMALLSGAQSMAHIFLNKNIFNPDLFMKAPGDH